MAEQEAYEMYLAVLNERHGELKSALAGFVNLVPREDLKAKVTAAKSVDAALSTLAQLLPTKKVPKWLTDARRILSNYIANVNSDIDAPNRLWTGLNDVVPRIEQHKWDAKAVEEDTVDFEAIFSASYAASRAAVLFDSMCEQIRRMIDCGLVDSKSALTKLRSLLSILERSRNGEYLSVIGGWGVARCFIKHALFEGLKKIAQLDVFLTAYEKTVEELDETVAALRDDYAVRVRERAAHLLDIEVKGYLADAPSASGESV